MCAWVRIAKRIWQQRKEVISTLLYSVDTINKIICCRSHKILLLSISLACTRLHKFPHICHDDGNFHVFFFLLTCDSHPRVECVVGLVETCCCTLCARCADGAICIPCGSRSSGRRTCPAGWTARGRVNVSADTRIWRTCRRPDWHRAACCLSRTGASGCVPHIFVAICFSCAFNNDEMKKEKKKKLGSIFMFFFGLFYFQRKNCNKNSKFRDFQKKIFLRLFLI